MENNSSDQQDKKNESVPKLNINFLKTLVIILALAIFSLIFVITYKVLNGDLNKNQKQNRKKLRDVMTAYGFKPYDKEWWHFTLINEPYPDTYFDF